MLRLGVLLGGQGDSHEVSEILGLGQPRILAALLQLLVVFLSHAEGEPLFLVGLLCHGLLLCSPRIARSWFV